MKKKTVVIKCNAQLSAEQFINLKKRLQKDYDSGLVIVPFYCDVFVADEVKTEVGNELL